MISHNTNSFLFTTDVLAANRSPSWGNTISEKGCFTELLSIFTLHRGGHVICAICWFVCLLTGLCRNRRAEVLGQICFFSRSFALVSGSRQDYAPDILLPYNETLWPLYSATVYCFYPSELNAAWRIDRQSGVLLLKAKHAWNTLRFVIKPCWTAEVCSPGLLVHRNVIM